MVGGFLLVWLISLVMVHSLSGSLAIRNQSTMVTLSVFPPESIVIVSVFSNPTRAIEIAKGSLTLIYQIIFLSILGSPVGQILYLLTTFISKIHPFALPLT